MFRSWRIMGALEDAILMHGPGAGPETSVEMPPALAAWRVDEWIGDPGIRHTLLEIAERLGLDHSPADEDTVLGDLLRHALRDGTLRVFRVRATLSGGGGQVPVQPPAPGPAPPKEIVNPLINPAKLVVLVVKTAKNPATSAVEPYTHPKRVAVKLSTDVAFDGTGTFTCDKPTLVKIWSAATGGVELKFDGKDNVWPPKKAPDWAKGSALSAGVTVYVEGQKPSGGMDDITLKLALTGGSKTNGPDDKSTVTSLEVTLDIGNSRVSGAEPVVLSADDKVFKGRFLHLNDPKRYYERAKLIVGAVKPAAYTGDLELVAGAHVKLFAAEKWPAVVAPVVPVPEPGLASPLTVPAAGGTFWVDGSSLSATLLDADVTLGVKGVEPEGDKVKLTVVKITFSKSPNFRWGYDDLDLTALDTHHISVKKSDFTYNLTTVEGPVTGAAAPTKVFFFTSDNAALAEATPPAALAPSFDLKLDGKDTPSDKDATNIHARINDANGPICATVRIHVYKLKELSATVVKVFDSVSTTSTTLTRPRFDVAAAQDKLNEWYKPAVCKITLTDHSATGDAIDVRYDLNNNGTLDIEPALTSTEEAAIKAVFNPAGQKVVIVKDLAWMYFLKTPGAVDDTTITLKDAYSGYMKFLLVGSSYDLGTGATKETISIASKAGGVITLATKLTKAHPITDGLRFGLNGLSGDPIYVGESGKTEAQVRQVIGHENGHSLLDFLDLEARTNLMHYTTQERTDTKIRYKEQPRKYDAGNEIQWDTVAR